MDAAGPPPAGGGGGVSVVIGNYNYARFLGEAIDSALALKGPRIEVIVVDDASTDDSRTVIAGYGDRVRAILKARNGGQVSAFNAGFAAARGEIVFFLDSDDRLHPGAAAAVLAAWRHGVAKVQFPLRAIDAEGRPTGSQFPDFAHPPSPAAVRRSLLATGLYRAPPTSGNAFARAALARIFPLPEGLTRAADGLLSAAAPLLGEVVTLSQPLADYRVHGGNAWAQRRLDPARFAHFVRDDLARHAWLVELAPRFGAAVAPAAIERLPAHLEYRMVSRKLAPDHHPVPGESVATLAVKGLAAARRGGDLSSAGRLALATLMLGMALAPRPVARRLAELRFVPERRPAWLAAAARGLGLLRHPVPAGTAARPTPPVR